MSSKKSEILSLDGQNPERSLPMPTLYTGNYDDLSREKLISMVQELKEENEALRHNLASLNYKIDCPFPPHSIIDSSNVTRFNTFFDT